MLTEITKDGKCTVVVSSHLLPELEKIATHYGIIRHGRMIREMTAEELDADCPRFVALKASDMKKTLSLLRAEFIRVEGDEAREYIRVYDVKKPETHKAKMNEERERQITEANARREAAESRIENTKK